MLLSHLLDNERFVTIQRDQNRPFVVACAIIALREAGAPQHSAAFDGGRRRFRSESGRFRRRMRSGAERDCGTIGTQPLICHGRRDECRR